MMTRRDFAATALAGGCLLPMRAAPAATAPGAQPGTLFSYAVCADTFWKDRPFLERLKLIADAGFTHFEFWRFADKDIDALVETVQARKLTAVQFVAGWSLNSDERRSKFLEELNNAIVVAHRLNVKMMTVIAGFEIAGVSREKQLEEVVTSLQAGAKVAAAGNVTLMIEATNILVDHAGQLISKSEDAAAVVKAVGSSNVRMLFDVYHQQVSEGNLTNNINKYKDLIAYYQIADHPGRHEPGTGEINFPHILRAIHATGYRGPLGLELLPKGDPLAALRAAMAADQTARALGS